jgi:hypothetical protein
MTLPYPHETETGQLAPSERNHPDPLDIERRVRRLVVPAGRSVDIAGHRLEVASSASVQAETERVCQEMTKRLLERRPNADEATWEKLERSLRTTLSSHRTLDGAVLHEALVLIDGL